MSAPRITETIGDTTEVFACYMGEGEFIDFIAGSAPEDAAYATTPDGYAAPGCFHLCLLDGYTVAVTGDGEDGFTAEIMRGGETHGIMTCRGDVLRVEKA